MIDTPKIFKNIIIASFFFLCFVYLGVEAKEIFTPPGIEIYSPANNLVINGQLVKIEGKIDLGAKVSINGKSILANNEGFFNEEIGLQPGANIIKISANKKYSKTNVVYRKVLVVEE